MGKGRLEAFTDGVIAIIITIMVLELKMPHGADFGALKHVFPEFLGYVLSFVYVGIYWNNHHHLFQVVHKVNGGVLWANLHLLFWLSLMPATTAWVGNNLLAPFPVAVYGVVLLCAGIAYYILTRLLLKHHPRDSNLAKALGSDFKGKISLVIYAIGIGLTFISSWIGVALYCVVAFIWLLPDRRIERILGGDSASASNH